MPESPNNRCSPGGSSNSPALSEKSSWQKELSPASQACSTPNSKRSRSSANLLSPGGGALTPPPVQSKRKDGSDFPGNDPFEKASSTPTTSKTETGNIMFSTGAFGTGTSKRIREQVSPWPLASQASGSTASQESLHSLAQGNQQGGECQPALMKKPRASNETKKCSRSTKSSTEVKVSVRARPGSDGWTQTTLCFKSTTSSR